MKGLTVIDGIVLVLDYIISDLTNYGFMNEKIPFIGVTPTQSLQFLDMIAHVAQDIQRSPAGSLQKLVQQLKGA